jgi:D-inositol-3-phosphate glycosyltransferase
MVCLHTSPADSPGSGDAGGMNVVVWHEARSLAAEGHAVDVITRRSHPDQPAAVSLGPGVTLRHLDAGPAEVLPKSAIDSYIPDFTESLSSLTHELAHGSHAGPAPYDLIHSQHWMSGVSALPVARAWGIPHVQSYHSVAALPGSELSEGEPPESPPRVPGEALLARESDLVVAISAAEARTVIERCGGDPKRVAIVPPGVDGTLFRPCGDDRADADFAASLAPHGHGSAVFAGRLQPLKGPDLAIAAVGHIPEAIRPDLIVAGSASLDFADYTAHLHRLIAELALTDYVHFIGPQDRPQLSRLLRTTTLCLVPSHSETFGLIALEAAACGTPVIAAAAGGLREAVVHGETGQLMDSRHPEDWSIAMMKLLTQPRLLHRMGLVSRVHARRFTWEAMAAGLTRLYEDLLTPRDRVNRAITCPLETTDSTSPAPPPPTTSDGYSGRSPVASPEPTALGSNLAGESEPGSASPADQPPGTTARSAHLGTDWPEPARSAGHPLIGSPDAPTTVPAPSTGLTPSPGEAVDRPATSAHEGSARATHCGRVPRRYLFVHAHPDDETLSSGAIILALRRQGAEPLVVTATRGERGEVVPAVAARLDQSGLAAFRLVERTRALAALGAGDVGFLGQAPNRTSGRPSRTYTDSGMTWLNPHQAGPAPDAAADALSRAPLAEVAADIAATARHWRADVLVSYDRAGGYGHPDHVRCHDATLHAAAALGLPCLDLTVPNSPPPPGGESPTPPGGTTSPVPGTPALAREDPSKSAASPSNHDTAASPTPAPTAPARVDPRSDPATTTTWYDAAPDGDRLISAHRCYSSQFTVDPEGQHLTHVGGQVADLVTRAGLRPMAP